MFVSRCGTMLGAVFMTCALTLVAGCSSGNGKDLPVKDTSAAGKDRSPREQPAHKPAEANVGSPSATGAGDETADEKNQPSSEGKSIGERLQEILDDKENSLEKRVLAAEALSKQEQKTKAALTSSAALLEEMFAKHGEKISEPTKGETKTEPTSKSRKTEAIYLKTEEERAERLVVAIGQYGAEADQVVPILLKAVQCQTVLYRNRFEPSLNPVALAAFAALGKVATPKVILELQVIAASDENPGLRTAAEKVLTERKRGGKK